MQHLLWFIERVDPEESGPLAGWLIILVIFVYLYHVGKKQEKEYAEKERPKIEDVPREVQEEREFFEG